MKTIESISNELFEHCGGYDANGMIVTDLQEFFNLMEKLIKEAGKEWCKQQRENCAKIAMRTLYSQLENAILTAKEPEIEA